MANREEKNQCVYFFFADKPIFSIDIHPDGTKFATGGQGNDSGRVVIWNLAPVISEKAEKNKQIPKILCQLDNHVSCVNSVRWSLNGSMLASGGVDKIIMLWKRGKGPSAVFGNGGITKTSENWRCTTTLRGHSGKSEAKSYAHSHNTHCFDVFSLNFIFLR